MTRTQRKIAFSLALLALAAAAPAVAAGAARDRSAGREAKLQRALNRVVAGGVPGAVLLVASAGGRFASPAAAAT